MAIIRTLEEQIDSLVSGNQIYTDNQQIYQYLYESYVGGESYREGNHLTRYQLETEREYQARLYNTHLENHCQSVVGVYNSFLFRNPPKRDMSDIENLPEVNAFLEDADLDGRTLDNFLKETVTWASVFGMTWVLMVKPNSNANTRAEELNQGVRPYVNLITPLMMLDWNYTRNTNGVHTLDYIRYIEDINGNVKTIREWTPESIKTTVVDTGEETITEEYEEVNGLGVIPAVCVYNKRSLIRGVGISDLQDIADAQKTIFNLNSEIESSIRIDSHPSLVMTPNTNGTDAGAGSIIYMPEDLDPALKPYMLTNSGANVDSILKTIEKTVEQIDKMANTGAVRATESKMLSGVSREVEFALLNARLAEKADNLEIAEEKLWTLFAMYQGLQWDGTIDYPDDFNVKDKQNQLAMMLESRKHITDPQLVAMLEKEIIKTQFGEVAMEEYEMEHPTLTEQNKQPHIEAMIMEGYTDQQILDLHPELTAEDLQRAKATLLNQGE